MIEIKSTEIIGKGIKFYIQEDGKEVGRATLYVLHNDLHEEPFGFLEDVYVAESQRGKGLGTRIVKKVIEKAEELGCYKLICTSRYEKPRVHKLYEKIGFKDHGKEFKIDF